MNFNLVVPKMMFFTLKKGKFLNTFSSLFSFKNLITGFVRWKYSFLTESGFSVSLIFILTAKGDTNACCPKSRCK